MQSRYRTHAFINGMCFFFFDCHPFLIKFICRKYIVHVRTRYPKGILTSKGDGVCWDLLIANVWIAVQSEPVFATCPAPCFISIRMCAVNN